MKDGVVRIHVNRSTLERRAVELQTLAVGDEVVFVSDYYQPCSGALAVSKIVGIEGVGPTYYYKLKEAGRMASWWTDYTIRANGSCRVMRVF